MNFSFIFSIWSTYCFIKENIIRIFIYIARAIKNHCFWPPSIPLPEAPILVFNLRVFLYKTLNICYFNSFIKFMIIYFLISCSNISFNGTWVKSFSLLIFLRLLFLIFIIYVFNYKRLNFSIAFILISSAMSMYGFIAL